MPIRPLLLATFAALALSAPAGAGISGVCPDGSIFIVQSPDAIPCRDAKRVDPQDLPPLQPELLPRPYGWERFNRLADPNNPYNLVDTPPSAGFAASAPQATEPVAPPLPAPGVEPMPAVSAAPPTQVAAVEPTARALDLALAPGDVVDLEQIIALSQSVAPAAVSRYAADGERTAVVELARSAGFEQRVRAALAAQGAAPGPVVLFRAEARAAGALHGNFTFVQGHAAFHPDPGKPEQLGVLDGAFGELAPGQRVLGYAVLPANVDPSAPIDIYWDDRRTTATLSPSGS